VQLVSKISNLCDPDPPTSQTGRRIDGQTDGRHEISILHYALVHRAVKTKSELITELKSLGTRTSLQECSQNYGVSLVVWDHSVNSVRLYSVQCYGLHWTDYKLNRIFYVDGLDVLYNKFNVTSSSPPVNPPNDTNSDYKCVIATGGDYWRLSRCTDEHRVVCQSG